MSNPRYQVLLYYKYTDITVPEEIQRQQKELCHRLHLTGRIIVAHEGINGTVEGAINDTEKYILEMKSHPLFSDMPFKKSTSLGTSFPKLHVRVRPEIVTAGLTKMKNLHSTGIYLRPEELHEWFRIKKEFYIVDMRNDYEYMSGYFQDSILSGLHNFYDLPQILPKLQHLKNKTIVTVCTGGVRCEKASGFLLENGFAKVYQLQDGIHAYIEQFPNEHFKGKLYVFDNRLTIGFHTDDPKHEIVGTCMHCQTPCDRYVNCAYDICHYHYICCEKCLDRDLKQAFCKQECKEKYLNGQQSVKLHTTYQL